MAATATETKERTIYTVKGTASGAKVELTKPARAAFVRSAEQAAAMKDAPGCSEEATEAALALERLLAKCK